MNASRPAGCRALLAGALLLAALPAARAADPPASGVDQAAQAAQRDLDRSLKELSELRVQIAAEKLPLTQEITRLEQRLSQLRRDLEAVNRELDSRNLDLNNLQVEEKGRQDEKKYLSNLLDEYVRNFESRVHISELQRYRPLIDAARLAPEKEELSLAEIFAAQSALVDASADRLLELVGGASFPGRAVDVDGAVKDVQFALVGPVALYATKDGSGAGLAEQKLGSLEPNMVTLKTEGVTEGIASLVTKGDGKLPFDPSLGSAEKIEETKETLFEHIRKGGPVMVPILLMAAAALVVAILKWLQVSRVRIPSAREIDKVLETIKRRDFTGAKRLAEAIPGPTGEMLSSGVEHVREPKELVEEVMYERILETRLQLQSYLPFVALAASAAPLLGLLGTVTGMINTFKLITVFGSGDPKTLSSGISEALITTEWGLIVAIPSLLIYAFLSRKVQRLIDGMEKTAVSFVNRLSVVDPDGERRADVA